MRTLMLLAALAVSVPPAGAWGQDLLESPGPRQGWYLGAGAAGLVSATQKDGVGWLGTWPGGAGSLRVGQSVTRWLDLGMGLSYGVASGAERSAVLARLSLEAQFPLHRDLFIRTGLGLGVTDLSRNRNDIPEVSGRAGDGWLLAVGWDWFPWHSGGVASGGWSVTPVVGFELGPESFFTTVTGFVGVELVRWSGLPKRELELPLDEAFE